MKNPILKNIILLVIIHLTLILSADAQKKNPKTAGKQSGYFTEEHALECVKDYYEFYNADECYKNPKVRRVSSNTFYISVKYCIGGRSICFKKEYLPNFNNGSLESYEKENEFFWKSKVLVLVCKSKEEYTIKNKDERF